jgi:hypothetical protein
MEEEPEIENEKPYIGCCEPCMHVLNVVVCCFLFRHGSNHIQSVMRTEEVSSKGVVPINTKRNNTCMGYEQFHRMEATSKPAES